MSLLVRSGLAMCALSAGSCYAPWVTASLSSDQFVSALKRLGFVITRKYETGVVLERRNSRRIVIVETEAVIRPERLAILLTAAEITTEELAIALATVSGQIRGPGFVRRWASNPRSTRRATRTALAATSPRERYRSRHPAGRVGERSSPGSSRDEGAFALARFRRCSPAWTGPSP